MNLPPRTPPLRYHVAISYAGEDWQYVQEVEARLRSAGLRVYCEEGRKANEIGLSLHPYLDDVFENQALCCLAFISRFYAAKEGTTMRELEAALRRARAQTSAEEPYLLPARFDETSIPKLPSDLVFADVGPKMPPDRLARLVRSRVLRSCGSKRGRTGAAQPLPAGPFLGRARDLKAIASLWEEGARLVVVHGEGGAGKTRLACEVVEGVPTAYKIFFKPAVDRPAYPREQAEETVLSEIAQAVGVHETEETRIRESLVNFLQPQRRLLLLDGFEHLREAGPAVEDLTLRCPGLRVLVTTRLPLRKIKTARHHPLDPLKRSDAIRLFRKRAAGARLRGCREEDLSGICELLGDLPLAIEVAAGASFGLAPPQILAELRDYLQGNGGDRLGMQKAMHASIHRSYDLLLPDEQELFRRLGIFEGGCTPESALDVCGEEDLKGRPREEARQAVRARLEALADQALLRREGEPGAPRFGMSDVVREFALHCLRSRGGEPALRRRHAEHFAALAERADRGIRSRERSRHMAALERERANLKAALEWSRSASGDRQIGLRLAGSLFWFWNLRAEFTEGSSVLQDAVASCGAAYAKALYGAGGLAFLKGEYKEAQRLLKASVAVWRTLGKAHERDLGYALIVLGMTDLALKKDDDRALAHEEEAREIFTRHRDEDPWGLALALNDLGNVRRRRGESTEALELYQDSLVLWEEMEDTWGIPLTRSNLGFLLMMDRKFDEARSHLEEALKIQRRLDDRWGSAETLKYLGDLAVREEKYQEAEDHYLESLGSNREIGRRQFMVGCLAGLAVSSAGKRRTRLAAFLFGAADALREGYRLSERIFDQEMFDQAWEALDPDLRNSPEFGRERADGARPESPPAKLERAIQRVLRDLRSPGAGGAPARRGRSGSGPEAGACVLVRRGRPGPRPEAGSSAAEDLPPLEMAAGHGREQRRQKRPAL